ncbi:hypothetical protein [Streptomyces sp. NBC_01294]|uniref:hypothetical protein n=1 Tax=Streptomyces sp. NBC_01294 TaxID=2903815 RepID=UPI002DD9E607|nr:hypothetical protein [Streptomyces sp. NBC_01294]WRZ61606.1 hypothetical protein OG534_37185 [Streptomyces sp. NBC_01294]
MAVADRLVGECLAAEGAHKGHFAALVALAEAGAAGQAGLGRRTGIYRSDTRSPSATSSPNPKASAATPPPTTRPTTSRC